MVRKGQKATKLGAAAGARNLANWKSENPQGGNYKYGGYSGHIRQRYSDRRTKEGKQLASIMEALIEDLGGAADITAAQRLLLENIRSKLIVLLQISKYVDLQENIINSKGELLPCLGRGYTTYSESLRRDLEALFSIKRKSTPLSYDKALKVLEGGKG
jgi:hypothetical protein